MGDCLEEVYLFQDLLASNYQKKSIILFRSSELSGLNSIEVYYGKCFKTLTK